MLPYCIRNRLPLLGMPIVDISRHGIFHGIYKMASLNLLKMPGFWVQLVIEWDFPS